MLPEGARRGPNQGLEGSGALPDARWAQSGRKRRFKSLWVAAQGGPGSEKKFKGPLLGALGPLLGSFFSFSRTPGGPPSASLRASGGAFGSSFSSLLLKSWFFEKLHTLHTKTLFFKVRGVQNRAKLAPKLLRNCFRQQVRP